jgi:flagellar basal-body rod protein FlgB
MLFEGVVNGGSIPAMDQTLTFLRARLEMIAENVANADTPGYRTKHLDAKAFQQALGEAMRRHDPRPGSPFELTGTEQFRLDGGGHLQVTPTSEPQENILFHDGTEMSIERQMADLAETQMMHQTVVTLLKDKYDGLQKAIIGRNV